ncbi:MULTISPECIES: sensor histidine kinase [Pseudomonas]|jgi:Signal transduction histidine kinase regulating C4-dicarboxylate transport system|uniref:sensor histidine kinase n=1 Tax=Pseudomonas TaxID=286 RepID=UPI00025FE0D1|nr:MULTISPECIES: HAMP domain-containing sensor histidine kinase [Pseudomonas]EIK58607.1 ATPase/histidine kinase/DNA gyrase B/HSP90 domain protein [Pseudomonas fluorescens Q8r1-96]KIR18610.1 Sensor protein FixL [Pseudomonas fluorescens]KAB0527449.1 HAMP domain-containing histidine kinase [Pseudomonas brassicacearum subsp. brassicacearum]NJP60210.1 HAMP domain-containing histidine kinase [Pseudomonas brassicacearum]PJH90822.1 sensor histidine kinase [Pseudomonas sp. WCS365]
MNDLLALLTDKRFMPHGHCYMWRPDLLWTNVIADGLIALSYVTIPFTLLYFIHKRKDVPFDWMLAAFGVFILACGTSHVMEILTIWQPYYWLTALVKVITAIASVITAILLVRLVPAALKIPSPQQLAKVNDELREAQAELVTTARRAGMAEIATNVLHNVGNVLNSVNVSAQVLYEKVHTSKGPGVAKVAQLMKEHPDDLGDFISSDPKGRALPDYLDKLADALAVEQQGMIAELAQLTRRIDHIKEIVATQQSYAGNASVLEPGSLRELVEDVVRICDVSLARHHITLIKEFSDVPQMPLDKHRVLQILVNLINNAKQALDAGANRPPQIILRLKVVDEGRVRVEVEDNGEGISQDNLARVFEHGFTTRVDGHGFGLHSCILAAHEMGGDLTVQSAGPGRGALFILVLPLASTPDRVVEQSA